MLFFLLNKKLTDCRNSCKLDTKDTQSLKTHNTRRVSILCFFLLTKILIKIIKRKDCDGFIMFIQFKLFIYLNAFRCGSLTW